MPVDGVFDPRKVIWHVERLAFAGLHPQHHSLPFCAGRRVTLGDMCTNPAMDGFVHCRYHMHQLSDCQSCHHYT